MTHAPGLTPDDLAAICMRAFPGRADQRIEAFNPLHSRQHEMVAFDLGWHSLQGEVKEPLILRRYVSTLSWWRPDDYGKAQREVAVMRWLREEGFPVPIIYSREFGARGDVVLFSRLAGKDWSEGGEPFHHMVRSHAVSLGDLLAKLHSLSPPEEVRSVLPNVTLTTALANLSALAMQIGQPELQSAVEQTLARAFDVPEHAPVVLHGDYHFSNVLLDSDRISGIVDWEFAALGDPRWDLANAYMQMVDFEAPDAANTFLSTYLERSGRNFDGPPLYNVVSSLQQWAISEWMVQRATLGHALAFTLAQDLVDLRDVHRRRAVLALNLLDG